MPSRLLIVETGATKEECSFELFSHPGLLQIDVKARLLSVIRPDECIKARGDVGGKFQGPLSHLGLRNLEQ